MITRKIILSALSAVVIMPICGCAVYEKHQFISHPHIQINGKSTELSNMLNIDGCYDMGWRLGPVHFEENGIVFADNGNDAGVYKLRGDTIDVEIYSRWAGGLMPRWSKKKCQFLILNEDSVKLIEYQLPHVQLNNGSVNLDNVVTIFTHYDCPKDFKPDNSFIRKNKWLWRTDEDRRCWMMENDYKL